ncbi:hypothetical protein [Streptomyces viridochromogenes]|uniref:hypothetical protein n=1 Tax=Streptomyces viridochromogenes TaxID=1938 RepID=UPI00099824CB|nr:hypothetical protein [Streptomyces viridochromogenes]
MGSGTPACPSGDWRATGAECSGGPVGSLRVPSEGPAVTIVLPPPRPSVVPAPSPVKAAAATATAPTTSSPEMRIPRETAMTPPDVLAPDGCGSLRGSTSSSGRRRLGGSRFL